MGRMAQMPARLAPTAPRLKVQPHDGADRSRLRDATQAWRALYKTSRWQKLRWSVLVRDLFTCRRCARVEANTSQLVADHTCAHRGDEALFWNPANLQCLCKPCHDSAKQAEERRRT